MVKWSESFSKKKWKSVQFSWKWLIKFWHPYCTPSQKKKKERKKEKRGKKTCFLFLFFFFLIFVLKFLVEAVDSIIFGIPPPPGSGQVIMALTKHIYLVQYMSTINAISPAASYCSTRYPLFVGKYLYQCQRQRKSACLNDSISNMMECLFQLVLVFLHVYVITFCLQNF